MGVAVGVLVGALVGVGVRVAVGVLVGLGVRVAVGTLVAVDVRVGALVGEGPGVLVSVGVAVGPDAVGVRVGVRVGAGGGVGVGVGVVGVGVGVRVMEGVSGAGADAPPLDSSSSCTRCESSATCVESSLICDDVAPTITMSATKARSAMRKARNRRNRFMDGLLYGVMRSGYLTRLTGAVRQRGQLCAAQAPGDNGAMKTVGKVRPGRGSSSQGGACLFTYHSVFVRIVHVFIGGMAVADGGDAVRAGFGAGDAAVVVVVVEAQRVDLGL